MAVRGVLVAATAAGVLLSGTGTAAAVAPVPYFTVDGVGTTISGAAIEAGVPYGSVGVMRDSDGEAVGKSHRVCVLEEQGAKYDLHHCNVTFLFDFNGDQITGNVVMAVPHPGTDTEPKEFRGSVTGGNGIWEMITGAMKYVPIKDAAGAFVPNKYSVAIG
ncbi:hypothetical protein ACFQ7O_30445 [Streptomyces sp. NPDC056485]|uniref:hypothetical protein n=1 Tax=Streptomyces sp. NPDC056485 TaxID=3345834 RepID=UPI0036775EE0